MNNAMQKKIILGILSLVLSMIAEVLKAEIVHDFSKSNLEGWYVIDDGVMGGRSRGQLEIENDDIGLFSGRISLQNYGGFSSIRYYKFYYKKI